MDSSVHSGLIYILLLVSLLPLVICQAPETIILNPCVSKPTCHECIQTPSCAWCFSPGFDRARCFQPSSPNPQSVICPEEYIYNPDNIQQILMQKKLSETAASSSLQSAALSGHGSYKNYSQSSSSSMHSYSESSYSSSHSHSHSHSGSSYSYGQSEIVQISPQRVNLKLRARQSYTLKMSYKQAEDYPVDLYYLMDLSKSMEDDKEKLSKLGSLLAETMTNITSNFRLGFGSFVDKVVMPYVSTVPKKLKQPCTSCEAPYGFRNHMTLSTNTSQFSHMVNNASVSGNLDAPEGGFDAIMQAIVCRNEIGWREKARRLLVFSTDAGFHYAGDGKLGGIITPNDGFCHLNRQGMYTHSSSQDYPSISQINLKVKQNAINVIFAVTESQIGIYHRLREHIEGSSCGQLSNDSSNIVELVKSQYEQISSSVELKDNATSTIKVNYYSQCLNASGPEKKTNKCGNIKVGDVVEFKIEIEVTSCPIDPKEWNQTLQIYPVGLNESLIVDIEMLCSCPCEKPGNFGYEEHSKKCSEAGTYKCGICECDSQHFGTTCQCTALGMNANIVDNCRPANSTVDCSGRGVCSCGRCECYSRDDNEKIYGTYCECDDFSCDRHEGLICGGPDHGICQCGVCMCKDSWGGAACQCKLSTDTCYAPDVIDGEICSGRGVCECGVCKCNSTDKVKYSGRFCEKCPTCADRCEEFKDCVQCQVFENGPLKKEDCLSNCTKFTPDSVDYIEKNQENDEILCTFIDEDDCRFYFVYYFDDQKKIHVKVQKHRECPPAVILTGIIFGVIAAIVLMGLAILLLWKLLTTIHDRREFAKFEKERMMARWDASENPIYKQATSTFKNPTYAGKG